MSTKKKKASKAPTRNRTLFEAEYERIRDYCFQEALRILPELTEVVAIAVSCQISLAILRGETPDLSMRMGEYLNVKPIPMRLPNWELNTATYRKNSGWIKGLVGRSLSVLTQQCIAVLLMKRELPELLKDQDSLTLLEDETFETVRYLMQYTTSHVEKAAAFIDHEMNPRVSAQSVCDRMYEQIYEIPVAELYYKHKGRVDKCAETILEYEKETERLTTELARSSHQLRPEYRGARVSRDTPEIIEYLNENFSPDQIAFLAFHKLIVLSGSLMKKYQVPTFEYRIKRQKKNVDEKYARMLDPVVGFVYENPDLFASLEAFVEEPRERILIRERIPDGILKQIPDRYIDLYPQARTKKRRFYLHIGPTNSGKTHDALERLKQANTGVYLAPLRLLAYEVYERLNMDGVYCTMKTGEEELAVPGATHFSSTIEMLDTSREFEVAVIDEAQMISDAQRGGSWTAAILGVCADEIHVCAAGHAKKLLIRLIESCGDECIVIEHERQTPLVHQARKPRFPQDIRKGDAVIVFSKRDVLAAASYLQKQGRKCSVIYGALPYDVRRGEVNRFLNGETDIVVATDAIGMGLNLPLQRIVFARTEKFDGTCVRPLNPQEAQQIAGRAGRRGYFDVGYYTSEAQTKSVRGLIEAKVEELDYAVFGLPRLLLNVEGKLSDVLTKWNELPPQTGFLKADLSREIAMCLDLEKQTGDKELVYRFITMAFDEENPELYSIWYDMFLCELTGKELEYDQYFPMLPPVVTTTYLEDFEEAFRICDLLYCYMDKFKHPDRIPEVMALKREISDAITRILSEQKLIGRKCRRCGRELPWNHPYGICDRCFSFRNG